MGEKRGPEATFGGLQGPRLFKEDSIYTPLGEGSDRQLRAQKQAGAARQVVISQQSWDQHLKYQPPFQQHLKFVKHLTHLISSVNQ